MLFSAGYDKVIRVWSVATRRLLQQLPQSNLNIITALSTSPDGSMIVDTSYDQTAHFFQLQPTS